MYFNEYQKLATYTCDPACDNLNYLICGLASEAGEVAGKYKKFLREDSEYQDITMPVAYELGDVLWYIGQIARKLNIDLESIATMNIQKLKSRQDRGVIKGDGDGR